jgi:asparagine synthase (glutamine-hydrolysing)
MKLQLGLLHTDGRPATADDLSALLADVEDKQVEISGEVIDDSLVVAYRGDRITWEDDFETQPLGDGRHILTWDGRLDNREDLARRLGLTHLEELADPVIVLKSYAAFGQSIFKDIVGEFALTLWCKSTKTLLFARSACGARPLYYAIMKRILFWSSDFAHLVRLSGIDLEINESYVLEYLLFQPSTKRSPLSRVESVPANHLVQFENGRVLQVSALWDPAKIGTPHCHTDHEYEEQYREKITEAVRVRLRAKSRVFAELSGGLDSSSIVLTADRILQAKGEPVENLRTVSCVYEQSQTCDESKFIRLVEERRGVGTIEVGEEMQGFTLGLQEDPEFTGLPNPMYCSSGRYLAFAAFMREHRARVLLTGLGGDHLFWSAPEGAPLVADALRRGNLLGAHSECRIWSRATSVPYLQLLLNKAVPLAIGAPYHLFETPNWMSHKTMRLQNLLTDQPEHGSPSKRAQLFSVDVLFRTVGAGYFNEYKDIYVSHPYTHRPLVEFCLAAPFSQFLRGGKTRSLMRRGLVDLLPAKICRRVSKAGADEAYIRALQQGWADNADVREWQVCERGFVDPARLSDSLSRMRHGIQPQSGHLMRLVSLERWLRSLGRIRAGSTAPRTGQSIETRRESDLRGLPPGPGVVKFH